MSLFLVAVFFFCKIKFKQTYELLYLVIKTVLRLMHCNLFLLKHLFNFMNILPLK